MSPSTENCSFLKHSTHHFRCCNVAQKNINGFTTIFYCILKFDIPLHAAKLAVSSSTNSQY